MKRFTFVLLALCGLWLLPLARSQTTTISGLPIISSPSTNTFLEVADMNASPKSRKYLLTNLATVTYVDARPTGFAGTVSNNVASAGLLAVDATKTNGVTATSAMVQTALGQVYQATNANLTGWSAIPATSAGVQATLGQVYQATNSNLTGWSAITADSAGIQSTLGQVYQSTNSTLTTLAGTTTTGTGQIVLSSVTDNKQPLAATLTTLSTNTTTGTGRIVLESAAGGGSAPAGTVINSTASNGLLAVDSTKTNGTAATAAMITNAWGIFDGSTTKFVAGDGTLQTPAAGTVYASNIVSGGQLPMGTLSADSVTTGGIYYAKDANSRGISSGVTIGAATNLTASTLYASQSFRQYEGSALTHAGTVTVDFDAANPKTSLTLTGNVTFAFSNVGTNKTYILRVFNNQATNCTLTFPTGSSTNFLGGAPTYVTTGKYARWIMSCVGTGDTNVLSAWAEN